MTLPWEGNHAQSHNIRNEGVHLSVGLEMYILSVFMTTIKVTVHVKHTGSLHDYEYTRIDQKV